MSYEIKFGTDGWRSVIADGYTFANVRRVTQAACDVARKQSKSRLILVGYDRRFFSRQFAETAAKVAVANGFRVEIASQPIGSPCLSFHVRDRKAAIGIMITASHNPAIFNGFKLKGPHGGSVDETITKSVEERVDANEIQNGEDAGKKVDFIPSYVSALKKVLKPVNFKNIKGPVIFDSLHGPGASIFERVVGHPEKIRFIRSNADPLFGGVNPEPIEKNLALLKETVLREKAPIGIAVDGDVDRIGVVDDKGRYLPPHTVLPLLLLHLVEGRKLKGKFIQTLSLGYVSARIAKHFNLPFEEVPVGFKHIAKRMGEEKVVAGGEESGGYGVGFWIPERDALLCAMLLLEMVASRKMPLSAIVQDMEKRFGASHFKRIDFNLSDAFDKDEWTATIVANLEKTMGNYKAKQVHSFDGVKVVTEDDSWFLLRPSGTEPLVRTYSEGSSEKVVDDLLAIAGQLMKIPLPSAQKKAAEEAKAKKKKIKAGR